MRFISNDSAKPNQIKIIKQQNGGKLRATPHLNTPQNNLPNKPF